MNKEVKFWILIALGLFGLIVIYRVANAAQTAENTVQTVLATPGEILQDIWNWVASFFGFGSSESDDDDSGETSDSDNSFDNTMSGTMGGGL